jgi:predicted Zn-dependent protease
LGQHEEAIREIKLARDLDPLAPRVFAVVGLFLYRARKYEEALAELNKAKKYHPDHPQIYSTIGDILTKLERFDEAIEYYEKSDNLYARKTYLRKAYLFALMKNGQKAKELIDSYLESRKNEVKSLVDLAAVYGAL